MIYSAWPTQAEFQAFLSAAGVWNVNLSPVASGWVDAAIHKFQMLTGRTPFLAETSNSSSFFDPPGSVSRNPYYPWRGGGKMLELDTGYVSIASVWTGYNVDNNPGTQLDLDRNLRLLPSNYSARGVPIECLEFFFNVWGAPGSIMVIGKRGYSTTIPADVWQAVLMEAAYLFSPTISTLITNGATELREADVAIKYADAHTLETIANAWHTQFLSIVRRYEIVRMGLND